MTHVKKGDICKNRRFSVKHGPGWKQVLLKSSGFRSCSFSAPKPFQIRPARFPQTSQVCLLLNDRSNQFRYWTHNQPLWYLSVP